MAVFAVFEHFAFRFPGRSRLEAGVPRVEAGVPGLEAGSADDYSFMPRALQSGKSDP